MSSQGPNERFDKDYWVHFADTTAEYMTAKRITFYILTIAICVQIIGMMIQPSEWLIWNALTFIIATNLGAVVLAIKAQHSADEIRVLYKTALMLIFITPSPYSQMSRLLLNGRPIRKA